MSIRAFHRVALAGLLIGGSLAASSGSAQAAATVTCHQNGTTSVSGTANGTDKVRFWFYKSSNRGYEYFGEDFTSPYSVPTPGGAKYAWVQVQRYTNGKGYTTTDSLYVACS